MRSKVEVDLTVDPPPERVIEVEITASAIRKLELFAKLGVAEVWRHDGDQMRVFQLTGQAYSEATESVVLPGFPLARAQAVIGKRNSEGEIRLVKEFRQSLESESG